MANNDKKAPSPENYTHEPVDAVTFGPYLQILDLKFSSGYVKTASPETSSPESVIFCGNDPCLQESDSFTEDEQVTIPESCSQKSVTCPVEIKVSSPEPCSPESVIYLDKEKIASPAPILQESDYPNGDEKAAALESCSKKSVIYPVEKNLSPELFSPKSPIYREKEKVT